MKLPELDIRHYGILVLLIIWTASCIQSCQEEKTKRLQIELDILKERNDNDNKHQQF